MSFLKNVTAFLPIGKKEEKKEYFFALNIGVEQLTAALWVINNKELKVLDVASEDYSSVSEIVSVSDRLLDQVLGLKEIEPQKILFGVPNSWLTDDDLKDEYLKVLRGLVKELELTPMAYVATSHSLVHFLEKQEGIPPTAILVGFKKLHLTVAIVRAGKLDGVRVTKRGESAGSDIEKVLLSFTDVETLPSKILIYGSHASDLKSQLLAFSWMSKLSFLHFPKIEVLKEEIEIKSVCLAGASEIETNIKFTEFPIGQTLVKTAHLSKEEGEEQVEDLVEPEAEKEKKVQEKPDDLGFVVGDVLQTKKEEDPPKEQLETTKESVEDFKPESFSEETELVAPENQPFPDDLADFEPQEAAAPLPRTEKKKFNLVKFIPRSFVSLSIIIGIIGVIALLIGSYVMLYKADVKVFVEPKVLERDAQVVADPNQKTVDEGEKIIPAEIVSIEVSGNAKESATGKRQIGDPAKGTVIIYNKTSDSVTLNKGVQISSKEGYKFTLDTSVKIASQSASDSGITFGKENVSVTAVAIGADGNLPSGSDFTVSGYASDKLAAKSEGNFSGGTSKDVTVVSNEDTQRLLAKLSSQLRQEAQQKLQDKLQGKKILQEALSEQITKKSYNKNVNDQASEFSLNMTVRYSGTAFEDKDLKLIVSKLVTTQVPDGFKLDISETETQADVSKLEKNGKLIFLARFRAKLIPKIDTEKIKNQIKFKDLTQATEIIKGMENVLGSEIILKPALPKAFERLPLLTKNISIEVGLK